MRSLIPKTLPFAAALIAIPYAAHAASDMPFAADAQRLTIIADQASGLDHGIMAAQRSKLIEPAEARSLSSEANRVVRDARRTAAREGGAIPADDYQSLLARLDGVNQKLLYDTGSGFMIGDGADGGTYPNG